MGREVRRVTNDWEHPRDSDGHLKPQLGGAYQDAADDWLERLSRWESGENPDRAKYGFRYLWDWDSGPPSKESYMYDTPPDPASLTHLMLYETTSEGTPLSPAFKTLDEIAAWAAVNATTFAHFKSTKEEWIKMLDDGFVHAKQGNVTFC